MANGFKQYVVAFNDPAERIAGDTLLKELSGFIDTDSADVQVDENSVHVRFVTTEMHERILKMCDDIKMRLDKMGKTRLFYKVSIISL